MQFVDSVDIGQINDIPRAKKCNSEKEQYGSGSDDNSDLHDAVSGCYRELELIPADMKWLAFISGELPNSARYFSSFADVQISENVEMGHTFGGQDSHFKSWNYKDRLKVVKLVEKHKTKLTKKQLAARTKVTEFIANQNSRQEFEPLLGPVIDKAVVEPLHLANNNWQFLFSELFSFVLHSKTVIPSGVKSITDLAKNCCLRRFLTCLKRKVKANRLYKSILRWCKEGRKTGAPFHFRFTGEETRLMCNGFCKLVHVVLGNEKCNYADLKVFVLSFMAVNLRDAVSVFSRITDMEEVLVAKLKKYCVKKYCVFSMRHHCLSELQ